MSVRVKRRLVSKASNKIGASTRKLAKEFGISQAYVRKILPKARVVYIQKTETSARTYRKTTTNTKEEAQKVVSKSDASNQHATNCDG